MKYLCLTKGRFIEELTYRLGAIVTMVGNLIYLIIVYYLWKAIYASSSEKIVNGMSFIDTLIYVVLASAMFYFMECFLVWKMGRDYKSGQLIMDFIKPVDYQLNMFFYTAGGILFMCIVTFIPTFVIVYFVSHCAIALRWNLVFFIISILLSICLNFTINFSVGLLCFYTGSIWGINMMKEVIVSLLSGATIPLAFFPDWLHEFVDFLPFQAIYNIPLSILVNKSYTFRDYSNAILQQIFWLGIMIMLSRVFFIFAKRRLTVNGG